MRIHLPRRTIVSTTAILCAQLIGCGSTTPTPSNNDATAQPQLFNEDRDDRVAALDYARDELILRVLPGAEAIDIESALARAEVTVIESITELGSICVAVEPERLIEAARILADEPIMEAVQKNYFFDAQRTPQDPRFSDQRQYEHIGLPNAWDITTGSSELVAAVLDTGVQDNHPDLAGKLLPGRNTFDNSSITADVFGHGTLVAGIIGARADNGVGVAGVNWETSILPVRVTSDAGRASSRAIASGLVWATNRGARVLNVSFAPLQSDGLVYRAARYAYRNSGLVFVSAGNDGRFTDARGSKEIVFVGATETNDTRASFSTTGPAIDLSAPGVALWSTDNDGGFRAVSGTSFASPVAAGVAGLIWSINPALRPITIQRIMRDTAIDLGEPGPDNLFGDGRIDAQAAVAIAQVTTDAADATPPLAQIDAPTDGETVSGTIRIAVSALDVGSGLGVADVTFALDGEPIATDTAEPYLIALVTDRIAPGQHTLTAIATDDAGNASSPATARIFIAGDTNNDDTGDGVTPNADDIPPRIALVFPINGATVSGDVGALATATDNAGLARIEWHVDGRILGSTSVTGTRADAEFIWRAGGVDAGDHTLTARAIDAAGNQADFSVVLTIP